MKALPLVAVALALAACSTVNSRINQNRQAFDSYPPETQARIREGRVEPGMTAEMVAIALGKPDRTYSRSTAERRQEVWAYGSSSPRTSVGIGVGGYSGGGVHTGVGVGVGTGDAYAYEDRERVVFEEGRVVSVERRER